MLGARTIKTEKIEIEVAEPDPNTGKSSASIGEGTIAAGQTQVVVETSAVTSNSRVFVTATTSTGGQALVVSAKKAGESFTVSIDNPAASDIKFDWFIIN